MSIATVLHFRPEKWVPEYRFHPDRNWRWDFANLDHKIAIEVQGGIFTGGRHSRGAGMLGDYEKFNAGALAGWRLLLYTPSQAGECARDLDLILGKSGKGKPQKPDNQSRRKHENAEND